VAVTSGWIETPEVRLHHLRYGSGDPAIVIVPGISQPAIAWEFVAKRLAESNTVYALDPRGRGKSGRPDGGYRLADYGRDLEAVVRGLGLEAPVILGHSMGARIAAAFAAARPEHVGASLIVDPPLSGPGRDPFPVPLEVYLDALHAAQGGATADDMRPFFPTWTDEQLRVRALSLPTCDERAIVESYRSFNEEDFFEHWRGVRPPALFMYGAESNVVAESATAEVRAANPSAEIVRIPDAGHVIPWDNLAAFEHEVLRFVSAAARPQEGGVPR
jgi:N-formylmaleamate deformylase